MSAEMDAWHDRFVGWAAGASRFPTDVQAKDSPNKEGLELDKENYTIYAYGDFGEVLMEDMLSSHY